MSALTTIYEQAITKFRQADYKILRWEGDKFKIDHHTGKKLNELQARESALDFVLYWYAIANNLPPHKKEVLVPNGQKKGVLKNITLIELLDFVAITKESKKHPTLIGHTEVRLARQSETAEIFTPDPVVSVMLGQLPSEVWDKNGNFCDPACGNGQFLIWVLLLKIKHGFDPLDSLKAIYGVDIMPDNVKECQHRLLTLISVWQSLTEQHNQIVQNNIVCADALTYDFEFDGKPPIVQKKMFAV